MPKYYRFRATTPTRKARQIKDKDKSKGIQIKVDKSAEGMLGLTLVCTPAPRWYLRRTAWRENPALMGPIRFLATAPGDRPAYIVNLPSSNFARFV